ncbi:hypothetical protein C4D60_Mb01t02810 [Musa balbisiana]|uniref:Wall-associated receptor kinase galacturonan-binding domain-containing protein n=1 Tax=Musa balbisiana TaxID=52838 RepID=A0A4S8JJN5_MUSBA|nr:hypothetical protein C4D60_Mb01t02810 [Musa balbisiana]
MLRLCRAVEDDGDGRKPSCPLDADKALEEQSSLPSLQACRNNTPIIHLPAGNYTVTNIDYKTHTISLANTDIVFVREECPRVYHNLTFDPDSVLCYAPSDVNLTFFFDCIDGPLDLHIPCLSSAVGNRSYVFTTETMRDSYHHLPRTCRAVVVVPVPRDVLLAYNADDLPTR